jgi:hypothetical protein
MAEGSRARIESSTFRESSGYGVFLNHSVEILGGTGNALEANALGAAWAYGTAVHYLLGADLLGNDEDVVVVNPNTITANVTWPSAKYHVLRSGPQGFYLLEGGLTLQPGTELRFEGDQSLMVDRGYLNALGTTDAPITFTGTEKVRGHWGGIGFIGADDPMNVLQYVQLEYGGGRNIGGALERANVVITMAGVGEHSSVTIRNSALWRSAEYGLWIQRDSELPGFEDNVLSNNALGPAYVQAPAVDWLRTSNIFTGNDVDEIAVETGVAMQIESAATWRDVGVPYHLQYHIGQVWEVDAALTIEPGVEMLMAPDLGITMRNGGSMVAEGEEMNRISMRAKGENWQGLEFQATTGSFDYIDIEDGGSEQWGSVLEPGTVTIQADGATAIVYFTGEVTLAGAAYGIVFSYGESIGVGCPGSVFIPPPDVLSDHCRPPTE